MSPLTPEVWIGFYVLTILWGYIMVETAGYKHPLFMHLCLLTCTTVVAFVNMTLFAIQVTLMVAGFVTALALYFLPVGAERNARLVQNLGLTSPWLYLFGATILAFNFPSPFVPVGIGAAATLALTSVYLRQKNTPNLRAGASGIAIALVFSYAMWTFLSSLSV